jgi:cell fate (sporulation/competence/biofilm development) regulator YlbF (YheA/YmcA/DUF963 family)
MDPVLEKTLQLGCLIRDTTEAEAWRNAWASLVDLRTTISDPNELLTGEIPAVAIVAIRRMDDAAKARPLMFPLLVSQLPPALAPPEIPQALAQYPEARLAFDRLATAMSVAWLTVVFLRRIGAGYPFHDLVYTLPSSPWVRLSNVCDLPLEVSDSLISPDITDAHDLGFERLIPSRWAQIAAALNELVAAIRTDPAYLGLNEAHRAVARRQNLVQELRNARTQFEREYEAIKASGVMREELAFEAERLAQKVYLKRGARIQQYADACHQFNNLIERIYWILSQIAMYEVISCINSRDQRQIQQVSLCGGSPPLLTAVAPTRCRTLEVGQLLHLTLPEAGNLFDGLYQVENLCSKYHVSSGGYVFFRARRLWTCRVGDVTHATQSFSNRAFIPSEDRRVFDGWQIRIGDPDQGGIILEAENLPALEFSANMYLDA